VQSAACSGRSAGWRGAQLGPQGSQQRRRRKVVRLLAKAQQQGRRAPGGRRRPAYRGTLAGARSRVRGCAGAGAGACRTRVLTTPCRRPTRSGPPIWRSRVPTRGGAQSCASALARQQVSASGQSPCRLPLRASAVLARSAASWSPKGCPSGGTRALVPWYQGALVPGYPECGCGTRLPETTTPPGPERGPGRRFRGAVA
jgi:hypothetical protein